jgi:16S rRNA processing protein RimM
MIAEPLTVIGKFVRYHGFKGELVIALEPLVKKYIQKAEWVFINIDNSPIPFFIDTLSVTGDQTAIIKLKGIDKEKQMPELLQQDVFILSSLFPARRIKAEQNELEGYAVLSDDKEIGIAQEILDYNGNLLLQIFSNGNEILLPINDESIVSVDKRKKKIVVNLPEGLLDLYL